MKRILALGSVALILIVIVATLYSNKKTIESKNVVKDRSEEAVAVKVEPVRELPINEQMQSPATLTASDEATISATTAGRIVSLSFDLGTRVSKGQIVGYLDMKETELKLKATEVEIERLQQEYERNEILIAGNATNQKAVDDSKYDLEIKRIEAEQLRRQIANACIISPISGIIAEKLKESGEYVNAGEEMAKIVSTASLKAKVFIPESRVFKLSEGQKAQIFTDIFPEQVFEGTISFISPKGDENHNYLVELTITNNSSKLKAGMYAMINFNQKETARVLQVSKAALVDGINNPYVFVHENGKVVEKKITIGRDMGEHVEVLKGLEKDELVVVSGQINLTNGSKVNPVTTKKS